MPRCSFNTVIFLLKTTPANASWGLGRRTSPENREKKGSRLRALRLERVEYLRSGAARSVTPVPARPGPSPLFRSSQIQSPSPAYLLPRFPGGGGAGGGGGAARLGRARPVTARPRRPSRRQGRGWNGANRRGPGLPDVSGSHGASYGPGDGGAARLSAGRRRRLLLRRRR